MRRARRFEIIVALTVALWGLAIGSAPAQEGPTGATAPAEAGVDVADILRKADAVKSEIDELVRASQPGQDVDRIVEKLPEFRNELDALAARFERRPPEQLDLKQLDQFGNDWARLRVRLERWQRVVGERASGQQANLESLESIEASWRGIRDGLGDDTVAGAVSARVEETLDQIAAARTEIAEQLAQVLDLEGQLLDESDRTREPLARIAASRGQARQALIIPEQPPLWRFRDSLEHPLADDVSSGWVDLRAVLSRFVRNNPLDVLIHALLSAGLLAMMLQLRRGIRKRPEQGPLLEQPSRLIDKPFSAALLMSLLLTRWIYDRPPEAVLKTAALLALPPLLLLLSALISRKQRPPLYALGALLVVDRVGGLMAGPTPLGRLLLLVTAGLGLAGMIWLIRERGPFADQTDSRWWRASRRMALAAAVGLGIALAANLAGSVALAGLIIGAVFLGIYFGLVFLAAYLVTDAVILIALDRVEGGPLRSVGRHAATIHARARWLLQIGFAAWWVHAILGLFHVRDSVLGVLGRVLGRAWTVGSLSLSIGAVLTFLLTVWISVLLSRVVDAVLSEDVLTRLTLPRGIPATISRMARYGIVTAGLLAGAATLGFELGQFAILAGALGVGIGFGLQDLVNNFVSGMILAFERPIRIGDTIETGTVQGTVAKIGLRSSVVRTWEGAEVIVPNGHLISSEVTNWTLSDPMRRMTIPVGVAYGTDPRKVEAILLESANGHEMVADHPPAYALFVGFGANSLDFEVRFWTNRDDTWLSTRSEVAMRINDALVEAGVKIPFPQRDVHLHNPLPPVSEESGPPPGG